MFVTRHLKRASALVGTLAILSNATGAYAGGYESFDSGHYWDRGEEWRDDDFGHLSLEDKIALLRKKVKYVFVIFHENESFDHYFGTFPGANGLFSAPHRATPANNTPSFVQKYLDTSLNPATISPFLMPQAVLTTQAGTAGPVGTIVPIYPADEISVDHSHQGMANDLDIDPTTGIAARDRYAMN